MCARIVLSGCVFLSVATAAAAAEVRITEDLPSVRYSINGTEIVIERNQDVGHEITQEFATTSRECPPFCIQPMHAGDGIETVGELELIAFLDTHVRTGKGLLVDSRVPEWYRTGSIPGALNLPFTALGPDNPYRDDILNALGGTRTDGVWNFDDAVDLLVFCNGPWSDQSGRIIESLLAVDYPAGKIRYYRGGMQLWHMLGLTVEIPDEAT